MSLSPRFCAGVLLAVLLTGVVLLSCVLRADQSWQPEFDAAAKDYFRLQSTWNQTQVQVLSLQNRMLQLSAMIGAKRDRMKAICEKAGGELTDIPVDTRDVSLGTEPVCKTGFAAGPE